MSFPFLYLLVSELRQQTLFVNVDISTLVNSFLFGSWSKAGYYIHFCNYLLLYNRWTQNLVVYHSNHFISHDSVDWVVSASFDWVPQGAAFSWWVSRGWSSPGMTVWASLFIVFHLQRDEPGLLHMPSPGSIPRGQVPACKGLLRFYLCPVCWYPLGHAESVWEGTVVWLLGRHDALGAISIPFLYMNVH